VRAERGIDVIAERSRTPGCATGHHFNAAGAALPTVETVSAITGYLRRESLIGGYEAATAAKPQFDAIYGLAAELLGARPQEIALVESATAGWQRAVLALRLGAGDRVLAARSSYVSSALQLLALRREKGVLIEVVESGPDGRVDLDALARSLHAGPVALVTAAHVPTTSGLVEPAEQIGALCRAHGVPFLLDATQSVGHLPVDVRAIGCDILVTTGRKFLRGPRGTGLLYVTEALLAGGLEPVAPDVRGAVWTGERDWTLAPDATRFELWEAAHALRLGLGQALSDLRALGVGRVADRLGILGDALRTTLSGVPGVRVTDPPAAHGAIVTFAVNGRPAHEVQAELARRGVHVVSVPASHGRWDLDARGLNAVVRSSAHIYNNDADVHALGEAVREISAAPAGAARPMTRTTAAASRGDAVDVVVAGLGIHGSAALYHLASAGLRVIGLEQFAPGQTRGSSHGATRMIRRAYPDAVWDPVVDAAYAGWEELAEEHGRRLVTRTGGIFAHPADRVGALRGPGCTELDQRKAREVAPGLLVPEGYTAVHDPAAGVIDAAEAWRAYIELADATGADIRAGERVVGFEPDGAGVAVRTPGGVIRAARLVLCAGPWIGRLVPELAPALRVIRIVNAYYGPGDSHPGLRAGAGLSPPELGVFSLELPAGLLYGIPDTDGRGVKVGWDDGSPCDPDAPRRGADDAELAVLSATVQRHLPAAGALREHLTCLYTMTQDRRFAVGPLPDTPQVIVASACSGHGFKFAPVIGAALADLVGGRPRPDLEFLSLARLL
jgi:monomeric sarcosine oxidase